MTCVQIIQCFLDSFGVFEWNDKVGSFISVANVLLEIEHFFF